jgi:hypothetical protein
VEDADLDGFGMDGGCGDERREEQRQTLEGISFHGADDYRK